METIKITIDDNGQLDIEVDGVKGGKCRDITKALTLLGSVTKTKDTAEAFEIPVPDSIQQHLSE